MGPRQTLPLELKAYDTLTYLLLKVCVKTNGLYFLFIKH